MDSFCSTDGQETVSGEENPDSDSNSTISSQVTSKSYKSTLQVFTLDLLTDVLHTVLLDQDERQVLKHHSRDIRTERSQRLQKNQSFMDSQGSGNSSSSSSEAWGSHTHSPRGEESPESCYQSCETSLSPLLHPTKRPALNPPPISNQATKGTLFYSLKNLCLVLMYLYSCNDILVLFYYFKCFWLILNIKYICFLYK